MTELDHDKRRALIRATMQAIYEAVSVCKERGAPAGIIYAALMANGCTLEVYQNFEASMIEVGVLRKEGHLLFTCPERAKELNLI